MQFSLLCKRITTCTLSVVLFICLWAFMMVDTSNIKTGWTVLILFTLFISTALSCISCMHYIVCNEYYENRTLAELEEEELLI